jgi:type IV pilus biogenesis protein CpaD/CtpE
MSVSNRTVTALLAGSFVLAGCGWSGYPYPGTAGNACASAQNPAAASAAMQAAHVDGCMNANNLAQMLDDPADAQQGRKLGPGDGERAALGVSEYQTGKVRAAAPPPSMTGATSQ